MQNEGLVPPFLGEVRVGHAMMMVSRPARPSLVTSMVRLELGARWTECFARRGRDGAVSGRNGRSACRNRSSKDESGESASEVGASALSGMIEIYHVILLELVDRFLREQACGTPGEQRHARHFLVGSDTTT